MNSQRIITVIGKDDNINVKNFETIKEFQDFYNLHQNDINNISTVKLNRLYHIKDYKITRRRTDDGKEEKHLYFRRLLKSEKDKTSENNFEDRITEIERNITEMKGTITKLTQQILEIIKVIKNSS